MVNKQGDSRHSQGGFTIVELMIATSVLSVIILLATIVMINIGNIYYKGYNTSRIQDAVRAATDQVSQDIQFSAGSSVVSYATAITPTAYPAVSVQAVCIGSARYSYVITNNLQIGTGPASTNIPHMLWRDTILPASPCSPADVSQTDPESTTLPSKTVLVGTGGQELVPPASRLNNFCVANNGSCVGNVGDYVVNVNMIYGDPSLSPSGTCLGGSGDQFCAADSLISRVAPRL